MERQGKLIMFNLSQEQRFWFYHEPVDMRLGFNGLSGKVHDEMKMTLKNGDVFIFINRARNRMKILHQEDVGLVLYAVRVKFGRILPPFQKDYNVNQLEISYEELIKIATSPLRSPYVRRLKLIARAIS